MTALRLSVVVVSHGRPRALARCLTGLSQMATNRAEVIVVADRDGLDVARSLPFADRLTLQEQKDPNISAARNAGVAHAAGEIVGFIDDDAVPEPTWAETILAAFDTGDCAAVTGPVLGRNGISYQWGRMAVNALGRDRWVDDGAPLGPDEVTKLHGTNMAVRRAALQAIGGFDPAFRFYLDETDLARRLVGDGATLGHVAGAFVHHGFEASARRTEARVPLDLFDIGASTVVFLTKHAQARDRPDALTALREDQRARLWRFVKRRKLDAGQMRHLMETLEAGIQAGQTRMSERVDIPAAPRPFQSLNETMPGEMQVWTGWRHEARRLRQHAQQRVLAGERMTLLMFEPTPRKVTVRFTDGGWWEHVGGLYGPAIRAEPRVQAWRFKSRVRAEIQRVSRERGIV